MVAHPLLTMQHDQLTNSLAKAVAATTQPTTIPAASNTWDVSLQPCSVIWDESKHGWQLHTCALQEFAAEAD